MAPGEPISINRLRQLSGQADVSALRARLLQRGLIAQQNGRYVRAETVNSARNMAPGEVKSVMLPAGGVAEIAFLACPGLGRAPSAWSR